MDTRVLAILKQICLRTRSRIVAIAAIVAIVRVASQR